MRDFKPLRPGQQLSAGDYNRLCDAVARQDRITVEPPLEIVPDGTGVHIRCTLPGFKAQILAGPNGSGAYSWQEMASNGSGVLIPAMQQGRTGTFNAYEENDVTTAPGTIVSMEQTNDNEFMFLAGTGAIYSCGTCIPFVSSVSCVSGSLVVTYSYLNFPAGVPVTISSMPCASSSSCSYSG